MRPKKFTPAEVVSSQTPASHQEMVCYDEKIDVQEAALNIEKETGIKVMAANKGEEPEGFLTAQYSGTGIKSNTWCGAECKPGEEHTCIVITLYANDAEQDILGTTVKTRGRVATDDEKLKIRDSVKKKTEAKKGRPNNTPVVQDQD